jgi:hypothetical protein
MSINVDVISAVARLAEGLCPNALLTLKLKKFLCLVRARMPTLSVMEWQFILPLKTLLRNDDDDDRIRCFPN